MWISELSERTEIPIDTIKHYLRVGVLPKGEAVAHRRAEYGERHVARLELIRAMTEVGEMKLESVRRVFDSLDDSRTTLRAAVGPAHYELSRKVLEDKVPSEESLAQVDRVIERQGWQIGKASVHRRALAVSIDGLAKVDGLVKVQGRDLDGLLDLYAEHMDQVAVSELGFVDTSSRDSTIRSVVVGTVLYEPLLTLLRRLAQENASLSWRAATDWIPAGDD